MDEPDSYNRLLSRPTLSETEVFADLDVAQDLSKRVPENDNQDVSVNLPINVDHKPSTSETNVSYGEEAPTPTDLVQGNYLLKTNFLCTFSMFIFVLGCKNGS